MSTLREPPFDDVTEPASPRGKERGARPPSRVPTLPPPVPAPPPPEHEPASLPHQPSAPRATRAPRASDASTTSAPSSPALGPRTEPPPPLPGGAPAPRIPSLRAAAAKASLPTPPALPPMPAASSSTSGRRARVHLVDPIQHRIVAPPKIELTARPAAAVNYSPLPRTEPPSLIVLHCLAELEGPRTAIEVAARYAADALKPARSMHYVADPTRVVRCVLDRSVAWHSGPRANRHSIAIGFCGPHRSTRADWYDARSLDMLGLAARLCAGLCRAYSIPAVFVPRVALAARPYEANGITTHAEVALAWGETRGADPGPDFPLAAFLAAVQVALLEGPAEGT